MLSVAAKILSNIIMFVLSVTVLLAVACRAEIDGSGSEDVVQEQNQLFNWDFNNFSTGVFEDLPQGDRHPIGLSQSVLCPDGWLRFSESCYFIEQQQLGFANAERRCFEKNATLFVANSLDEWDAIRQHTPKTFFSWIGLVRFTQFEKVETTPRWQTEGGVEPSKINWLIRPYAPVTNGWSALANCVAHYNPAILYDSIAYSYYYPCTFNFYSVCERNTTLTTLIASP